MFNQIKDFFKDIFSSRLFVTVLAFILLFGILIQRLFYLQIVKGENYLNDFTMQIQKTREIKGTRGNIYDRNGELLAYDELAYSVTIEDTGAYDSKPKELNKALKKLITIIEENGDSMVNDFGIILNDNQNYEYTATNDTKRLRFIADIFGQKKTSSLKEEQRSMTADELMEYLCSEKSYHISDKYEKDMKLKIVNIRYNMGLNRFQKYIPTTVASDVSDETVSVIMENMDELQGVDISEESLRHYEDSEYFSSLLGYTGKISQDEYDAFLDEGKDQYSLTDIVGKAGIEQVMDSSLQGKKGEESFYVNNVGKITKKSSTTDPVAGNNLYLTIDKKLQRVVYKIIEQKLAGILLTNIQNIKDFTPTENTDTSKIPIPINDVYFALFNNEIINISHFSAPDAKETEQLVYQKFLAKQSSALDMIRTEMESGNPTPYKNASSEMKVYMSYIVNNLLTKDTGILIQDKINEKDKTYQAWKTDETISLKQFLEYAISQNWIDTSKLEVENKYSDSKEIYKAIVNLVVSHLPADTRFNKKLFKYMLDDGKLTGAETCQLLLEQGVLAENPEEYESLKNNSISAFNYIRTKIQNLEITPAQLALEPCTGSAVLTDVKTGDVLACVSYPGYDNNKLANTMDSDYYQKLQNDLSKPLLNYATQQKTAPGSTFKPITGIAGMEEKVISSGTYIHDNRIFDAVYPPLKCWINPGSHGDVNVTSALQHSCNYFFSEVGYRLSLDGTGKYSSKQGLKKLEKYAKMFGLGKKSGLEIAESEPEISNSASVPSSIGQGTHNFTVSQIARYVSTLANDGKCYDLTLLGRLTDHDGKTIKDYQAKLANELDNISAESFRAVKQGMRNVVLHTSAFNGMKVELAGKTGTAQQSKSHPSHAVFVGFAPFSNPEVALTVRIANGYTSGNAVDISKDIMNYYYNQISEEAILNRTATLTSSNIAD